MLQCIDKLFSRTSGFCYIPELSFKLWRQVFKTANVLMLRNTVRHIFNKFNFAQKKDDFAAVLANFLACRKRWGGSQAQHDEASESAGRHPGVGHDEV